MNFKIIKEKILKIINITANYFSLIKKDLSEYFSKNKKAYNDGINFNQKILITIQNLTSLKNYTKISIGGILFVIFIFIVTPSSNKATNFNLKEALMSGDYMLVSGIKMESKLIKCSEAFEDKYFKSCEKPYNGKCDITLSSYKNNFKRKQTYTWSDSSKAYLRVAKDPRNKIVENTKFNVYKTDNDTFVTYYPISNVGSGYRLIDGYKVTWTKPICIGNCDQSAYKIWLRSYSKYQNKIIQRVCKNKK